MLKINDHGMNSASAAAVPEDIGELNVSSLVSAAKRGWLTIFIWMLVLLAVAVAYLAIATPLYLSTAEIIIDPQTSRTMESANGGNDTGLTDTSLVDSQVEILSSDGIMRKIVKDLNLAKDPEFVGTGPSWFSIVRNNITSFFGAQGDSADTDDPEAVAIETFGRRLSVKRTGLTYVITVSFYSESPSKAALIANALASTYQDDILENKYAASKKTGDWLEARIEGTRQQAAAADRAVETFKTQNNIVDTNHGQMDEQQLGELNSQLALASAATAEAEGRYRRAQAVADNPLSSDSSTSEIMSNPVYARLRAQYLDLSARAGDLTTRLGAKHEAVLNVLQRIDQIKKALVGQRDQIVKGDESDYEIALAREKALRASIDNLVSTSDKTSLASVKLRELEGDAESLRAVYTTNLQRFQQISQQTSFPISDARIVTSATPALKKASPKGTLVLGGSLIMGAFIGLGQVLASVMLNKTFTSMDDVRRYIEVPCFGFLPIDTSTGKAKRARGLNNPLLSYVTEKPFSRFAETLRLAKISIDSSGFKDRGRVIAVTSAIPGEGKTTVAINLAQLIAETGSRTLLIDADITRRIMTEHIAQSSKNGLIEVVRGTADLPNAIEASDVKNLDILPCLSDERVKNRTEILQSEAFAVLIAEVREKYAYVIIDVAPIVPVVDARIIAPLIDAFLLVIEWHKTTRKVVQEAMQADGVYERVVGAVLNKAEQKSLRQMESYRGKSFESYYSE